jgi:hypothetical protein
MRTKQHGIRNGKSISLLCLGWVCCAFFQCGAAYAREYTIKQIADKTMLNREPVISGTGLIAWYAYDRAADNQSTANIYIYRNGVAEELTQGENNLGLHPSVHDNTVVWEGQLAKEVEYTERRAIQEKAAVAPPLEGEGDITSEIPPDAVEEKTVTRYEMVTRTQAKTGWGICRWDGEKIKPVSFSLEDSGHLAQLQDTTLAMTNALVHTEEDAEGTGLEMQVASPTCWGDYTAWQKASPWPCGWEIVISDGAERQQLMTNCYYDMGPQLYENKLVWYGWDGQDFEIFMFDVTTGVTTQLTDNGYDDMSPVIWENTVVWEGYPAVESDIFMWQDGVVRKISDNIEDDVKPRIWQNYVVWQGVREDNYEIFLYDGTVTRQITDNGYDDVDPDIRDNLMCWIGYVDNWDAEVILQGIDETEPTILTDNDYEDHHPRTAQGKVVWEAKRKGLPLIYVAEPR